MKKIIIASLIVSALVTPMVGKSKLNLPSVFGHDVCFTYVNYNC